VNQSGREEIAVDPREKDLSPHGAPLRGGWNGKQARRLIQKIFLPHGQEREPLVQWSKGVVLTVPQGIDLTALEEADREHISHHFQTIVRGHMS
jgi:hypothetical protein